MEIPRGKGGRFRFGNYFRRLIDGELSTVLAALRSEASQLIMHPLEYGSMFQDRAGTIPVTESGQLIGHCLDIGPGGYHATAISDAARGFYAVVPKTGRRNLLTWTEQFDNAFWSKSNGAITANAATAPDGTTTADKFIPVTATASSVGRFFGSVTSAAFTTSIYVKYAGFEWCFLVDAQGNKRFYFNLLTGESGTIQAGITGTSVVDEGDGWYRISVTSTVNSHTLYVGPADGDGSPAVTGDGTSGIFIWGAQLEASATATLYQKVVSQYEVTEAGVPSLHYVAYNGVNTAYLTPMLPAPGVDKAQVFAGLRKLSDAVTGIPVELGASSDSNNGTFHLAVPDLSLTYGWFSRGTTRIQAQTPASFAAPITNIVTGIGDISGDNAAIRVNGTQIEQSTADQGSGNFNPAGTYPLYYGARAGTSIFFNGHHYRTLGPIVRFGTNATPEQIAAAEAYYTAGLPS